MSVIEQAIKESTAISGMAFGIYLSLPSLLLLIQSDEDAQRLVELYHQYKRLMFKVAQQYFHHDQHEMEDVISDKKRHSLRNALTLSMFYYIHGVSIM